MRHIRTVVMDAVLDGCSFDNAEEINAFEDVCKSATIQACKSQDNLLYFDEYMGVEL